MLSEDGTTDFDDCKLGGGYGIKLSKPLLDFSLRSNVIEGMNDSVSCAFGGVLRVVLIVSPQ